MKHTDDSSTGSESNSEKGFNTKDIFKVGILTRNEEVSSSFFSSWGSGEFKDYSNNHYVINKSFNVIGQYVDFKNIDEVTEVIPTIYSLYIKNFERILPKTLCLLLKKLKEINCIKEISVKILDIRSNNNNNLLQNFFRTCTSLTKIIIHAPNLTEKTMKSFYKAIEVSSSIKEIGLKNMKSDKIFNLMSLLSYIDFTHLDFGTCPLTLPVIKKLKNVLEHNTTITSINVSNCSLKSKDLELLSSCFMNNCTITAVDISENFLVPGSLACIAKVLRTNSTITQINMEDTNIGSKDWKNLLHSLRFNNTLTRFNLSKNKISDYGFREVQHFLRGNTALTELNFIGNPCVNERDINTLLNIIPKLNSNLTIKVSAHYTYFLDCPGQRFEQLYKIPGHQCEAAKVVLNN